MTVQAIIIIIGVVLAAGIHMWKYHSDVLEVVLTVCIAIVIIGFVVFYSFGTEAGKRVYRTQQSNFENETVREVLVYDACGNILESYRGKFDISYSDERILFDDEETGRHVIYFKTGTVIVNDVN